MRKKGDQYRNMGHKATDSNTPYAIYVMKEIGGLNAKNEIFSANVQI